MERETLSVIRQRIETLATADGDYYVVCGRTGRRPVPVEGTYFPDRETATEAAQTATAYRRVLREYDEDAPFYDFIVCEDHQPMGRADTAESTPQREGGA